MSSNNPTLYDRAVALARERGGITNKLMQGELRISFKHARELLVEMEAKGVVGPARSRKPREVLTSREQAPSASPTAGANGAETVHPPVANGGVLSTLFAEEGSIPAAADRALLVLGLALAKDRITAMQAQLGRPQ